MPNVMLDGRLVSVSPAVFKEMCEAAALQKQREELFIKKEEVAVAEKKAPKTEKVVKHDGLEYNLNRQQLIALLKENGVKFSDKQGTVHLKRLWDRYQSENNENLQGRC